jgi:hypothetical protein
MRLLVGAFLLLALPLSAAAETGVVAGRVVDASTGAPLPGAILSIAGANLKTMTAADGTFTLTGVPAGRQQLVVSLVGYGLAKPVVTVAAGATTTITIPLAQGTGAYAEHVTVTPDRFRGVAAVVPGAQVLTSADMQDLRGVLTDDPFRAVQALPGVTTGDDFRSEFAVRGSDFMHIGLSVDGIASRWLTHQARGYESNGSVALLHADTVGQTSLFAGAAPQELPGRTGARLDFGLREGSRAATAMHASISMTSASVVAEGPIGASKRGSWIASFRQSYVQWVLKRLHFDGAAFGFMDGQAKLVYDVTPTQQVQLTFLAGRSRLDLTDPNSSSTTLSVGTGHSGLAILGWRSTGGSSLVITQQAAILWDQFHNVAGGSLVLADGTASELAYRANAVWTPSPRWTVQAGAYLQRPRDNSRTTTILDAPFSPLGMVLRQTTVNGSARTRAADARVTWIGPRRFTVDAGAQVSRSTLGGGMNTSPWLLAEIPLAQALSIHAGAGGSSQAPDFEQTIGTYGNANARSERARNYDLGLDYRLTSALRLQVSGYLRGEDDVLRLENSETRMVNGQIMYASALSVLPAWTNALTGSARGLELVLQRRSERGLSGWISYAYGHARYTDAGRGEAFAADADQRHTFNLYAQYRRSPRTSFSAKLRTGTNFPIVGYFEQRSAGLYAGSNRNTVRLPAYARLDLRANRTFTYAKRRLTLFMEVVNALNRTNCAPAFGTIRPSGQASYFTQTLFPILPSVGFVIDF